MYTILTVFFQVYRQSIAAATIAVLFIFIAPTLSAAQTGDDAEDIVAVFNQAQNLHEKGDLAGAIKLYEKALKIQPDFPEAEYQRGIAQIALGKNVEAETSFRRAVGLRPDWTLALASLGSILVSQAKYSDAQPFLARAIDLDPQNFPALGSMTELLLETKAPIPALNKLLSKITELSTKANPPVSIWVALAALQRAVGLGPSARISINKALSIDAKNKFAIAQSAEIALSDGDIERAAADAELLEKISSATDIVTLLRARILVREGKADEALRLLGSNNPRSIKADELRAKIAANNSESPQELEKQLEKNAKDPYILGRLCNLYRRDDPTKALGYCRRASEAEPGNIDHAVGYGAALVQAKQFDAAINLLKKVIEIVPENWTAHANLATALFELKRFSEAKGEFEWLTVRQPRAPAAYYFLAIAHDQMGEYWDALANYQQYLRLADPVQNKPDIDKVNFRLPQLQRQVKDGKGKKNEK